MISKHRTRIISAEWRGNLNIKMLLKYLYVLATHGAVVLSVGRIKRGRDVLLLRLDALGDFIVWLDAAKEYRNLYPGRRIILLVNAAWVELARSFPYWDDVWTLETETFKYQPFYRMRMLARVRRHGFETVVQARFSREFLLEDSLVLSSDAAQRISLEGDLSNLRLREKKRSDAWYTRLLSNPPLSWGELRRNAELIRGLGLTTFKAGIPRLTTASVKPAGAEGSYYVICPGAGRDYRRWPVEFFAEIAEKVHAATGMKGLICGSGAEKDLAVHLMSLSKTPLVDMTGQTSVSELISLIQGAKFVLCNETAAVHIAAAVGTKAICILGGGHFGRFVPYQVETGDMRALPQAVFYKMECYDCGWSCKYQVTPGAAVPCIAKISVEEVWQKINTVSFENRAL